MRVCFEDGLHAIKTALSQLGEGGSAMINRWMVHRPQNAIRNICWAGNLKEMATGTVISVRHNVSSRVYRVMVGENLQP
jgi:hypothetical protein